MKKTYADHCLEMASLADEGPWTAQRSYADEYKKVIVPSGYAVVIDVMPSDADFIAASRTYVPLLANKLKSAIEKLKELGCSQDFIEGLESDGR